MCVTQNMRIMMIHSEGLCKPYHMIIYGCGHVVLTHVSLLNSYTNKQILNGGI